MELYKEFQTKYNEEKFVERYESGEEDQTF